LTCPARTTIEAVSADKTQKGDSEGAVILSSNQWVRPIIAELEFDCAIEEFTRLTELQIFC
jgi:hypothetical protein